MNDPTAWLNPLTVAGAAKASVCPLVGGVAGSCRKYAGVPLAGPIMPT
jgi:hypothetical protein